MAGIWFNDFFVLPFLGEGRVCVVVALAWSVFEFWLFHHFYIFTVFYHFPNILIFLYFLSFSSFYITFIMFISFSLILNHFNVNFPHSHYLHHFPSFSSLA